MGELVVGIDIGTTKVCTIVGEVRETDINVLGVGIEPSHGMRKGMVTDVMRSARRFRRGCIKAERSSATRSARVVSAPGADRVDQQHGAVGIL